jgi:hypothetical protein
MSVTLGDKRPSYSTVKDWVARFRKEHLSTEDECSGRPTQVTIPENVYAIQAAACSAPMPDVIHAEYKLNIFSGHKTYINTS